MTMGQKLQQHLRNYFKAIAQLTFFYNSTFAEWDCCGILKA
ncbi:MAG: hypothetical protein US57_C0007G0017 [Candidatus Moranbacteria bacterium GW2011_GWC2_37_73]|nr:MAG: hypothetical protein UR95_C0004G0056 [Parcubacteria group bacterium GW2011_GWC1_36_108]KKQ00601.1 MAG: hypothetical protein US09_C0009G0022 [Candidatus Moranbacteria bacterium GW2011_GWD1_36_198]KKQ02016.1 MAG: hypothetical protein US10_C0006G0014 [Candidatus Moranbacteria bacterium GW2011_GWD2_36_198]KKQ39873.1 MAG: hypothetical protein US57_C0007G0017 [Candidatus Moranbacteria bacterium GW2011_GWC2_37_73]